MEKFANKLDLVSHSGNCLSLVVYRKPMVGLIVGVSAIQKKYFSDDSSLISSKNSEDSNKKDLKNNSTLDENDKVNHIDFNNENDSSDFNPRKRIVLEKSSFNKYYIKGNNLSNNFIIILNSPNLNDASLLCVKYNSKQYLEYTNHPIYYKILYIIFNPLKIIIIKTFKRLILRTFIYEYIIPILIRILEFIKPLVVDFFPYLQAFILKISPIFEGLIGIKFPVFLIYKFKDILSLIKNFIPRLNYNLAITPMLFLKEKSIECKEESALKVRSKSISYSIIGMVKDDLTYTPIKNDLTDGEIILQRYSELARDRIDSNTASNIKKLLSITNSNDYLKTAKLE